MPIEADPLRPILRRIAEVRLSNEFGVDDRVNEAIVSLEADFGDDGRKAAEILRRTFRLGTEIDKLAVRYLLPLRLYSRRDDPNTTGLRKRLRQARPGWRALAFNIRPTSAGPRPDPRNVFDHPRWLANKDPKLASGLPFANAVVSEIAMELAEAYDAMRTGSNYLRQSRSLECDDIMLALGEELPKFAKIAASQTALKHRRIASAYRRHEHVSEALRGEALVLEGRKAFETEEEEDLTSDAVEVEGVNGESVTTTEIRKFIREIGNLPAYGAWGKAETSSRVVAMARAIQGLGTKGITFTLNLHAGNYGRFVVAERQTHSAIQDQLAKLMNDAIGRTVDFYFVLEQGVDESPHLHGTIALDPTEANLKTVRSCLKRLAQSDRKAKAPERLVKVDPLRTPGRWGGYAVKAVMFTSLKFGTDGLVAATRGIRNQAKVEWELMRAEQRDAKRVLKEAPRHSRSKGRAKRSPKSAASAA